MIRAIRRRLATLGDPNRGWLFPLLGFPVKVHPTFWLVVVLAAVHRRDHPGAVLVWITVVFVSILAHELGHALVASRWSVVFRITIHGLGGETNWRALDEVGWRRRVLISLAGPGAGIAVGSVAYAVQPLLPGSWLLHLAASDLLWVNVAWGAFNLLPIPPLDGGQVLTEMLYRVVPTRAEWYTALTGTVAAIGAGVAAVGLGQEWAVVLLAFYGFRNGQLLKLQYDANRRTGWQNLSSRDQVLRNRY